MAAIVLGCGAWGRRRLGSLPALDPQRRRDDLAPIVDVVVPVRDRAGDISGCVLSLWAAGANRVIVVDDASTDGTARLAAAVGAEVVTVTGAPPGWHEQPYSCWIGGERATAGWVAWVDAGVRLAPGSLDALVEVCEREGLDAASPILPQTASDRIDRLILPLAGWTAAVGLPRSGRGLLGDHCLLVRRDAYERVGGHAHASLRQSPAADLALARALAGAGTVGLVAGDAAGAVRARADGTRPPGRRRPGTVVRSGFGLTSTPRVLAARAALTAIPVLLAGAAVRPKPGRLLGAAAAYAGAAAALAPAYARAGEGGLALLHPLASVLLQSPAIESLARRLDRPGLVPEPGPPGIAAGRPSRPAPAGRRGIREVSPSAAARRG